MLGMMWSLSSATQYCGLQVWVIPWMSFFLNTYGGLPWNHWYHRWILTWDSTNRNWFVRQVRCQEHTCCTSWLFIKKPSMLPCLMETLRVYFRYTSAFHFKHTITIGFLKHSFLRGWPFQRILGIHGKLALADHIKPRMGTVTCTLLRATVVWWPLGPHHRYMYLQKLFLWGSTTADDLTKSWTTRISSPSKFVGCCVLHFLRRDHLWKMVWLSSTAWVADWKKKLHKQRQLTTAICHSNFLPKCL